MKNVSLKLPDDLHARLNRLAKDRGAAKSVDEEPFLFLDVRRVEVMVAVDDRTVSRGEELCRGSRHDAHQRHGREREDQPES